MTETARTKPASSAVEPSAAEVSAYGLPDIDTLFQRFLDQSQVSFPDIDTDFYSAPRASTAPAWRRFLARFRRA